MKEWLKAGSLTDDNKFMADLKAVAYGHDASAPSCWSARTIYACPERSRTTGHDAGGFADPSAHATGGHIDIGSPLAGPAGPNRPSS
jgi:hypothetical protein